MSNDLISREALKEMLKECAYSYDGVNTWIMKDEVLGIIDKAPTVEKRPKGKWINFQKSFLYGTITQCSRCDNTLNMNGVNAGRSDANFCPNCGADMRGDV